MAMLTPLSWREIPFHLFMSWVLKQLVKLFGPEQ